MIELPPGSFTMGVPADRFQYEFISPGTWATPDNLAERPYESPPHVVEMDMPLAMGRDEVTFGEWMACVDDGGCMGFVPTRVVPDQTSTGSGSRKFRDITLTDDHPVHSITYELAMSYADWLNAQVGAEVYRLPTDAEWEYAARAGTTTRFAQGDHILGTQGNFAGDTTRALLAPFIEDFPHLTFIDRPGAVTADELDTANQWGFRHMSGNMAELTLSCFRFEGYAGWSTASEWLERSWEEDCRRTLRGGSFLGHLYTGRVSRVVADWTDEGTMTSGFRLVRQLN